MDGRIGKFADINFPELPFFRQKIMISSPKITENGVKWVKLKNGKFEVINFRELVKSAKANDRIVNDRES